MSTHDREVVATVVVVVVTVVSLSSVVCGNRVLMVGQFCK